MSSSRNKRKRPENDSGGAAAAPGRRSRREQRAQTQAAPEPASAARSTDSKNEEETAGGPDAAMAASTTASPENSRVTSQHAKEVDSKRIIDMDMSKKPKDSKTAEKKSSASDNAGTSGADQVDGTSSTGADPGSGTSRPEPLASQLIESVNTETTNIEGGDVDNAGESNDDDESREARIQAILNHRKLLQYRMKLCRSVAEDRLVKNATKSRKDEDTKTTGKKGVSSHADGNAISKVDQDEIASFREMTRLATLAAKKSRSDGDSSTTAEKRTSLSLRRGSSVGKRMNAALSSLAPGASAPNLPDAKTPANPLQVTNPAALKSLPKTPQAISIAPKPTENTASARPMTTPSGPPLIPSSKPVKTSSSQLVQRQSSVGAPAKYETAQKGRPPNSKGMKSTSNASSRMSSTNRQDPATMPLHIGAGAGGLPQNRLAQPKVIFPEAMSLREQRNRIRSKLVALLERKKQNRVRAEDVVKSPAAASGSRNRSKITHRQPAPWEPRGAPLLPRRRKTHWDHLLQEMTWMATDFIEERKWKRSAARTLGSAILAPSGFAAVSPRASQSAESLRNKANGQASNDEKEQSTKQSDKSSSRDKSSPRKAKAKEIRQYVTPSLDDVKATRRVASVVSCMVTELGAATLDSGSVSVSADANMEALERFKQFQKNPNMEKGSADVSTSVGDASNGDKVLEDNSEARDDACQKSDSSSDVADEQPVGTVESVTDFVKTSFQAAVDIREKIPKRSKSKSESPGISKLSPGQKDATEFVNELWKRNSSLGAILVGPAASGKTIAACSLLWKQRSNGPQLLVCPPASVIRWAHELGRFKGLNVTSFGVKGGISSPSHLGDDVEIPDSGDVVVCEYSAVSLALSVFWKHRTKFQSLVIDCRHPTAFSKQHGVVPEKEVLPVNGKGRRSWNGPVELLSMDWWGALTNFLRHGTARRLIIEFPGPDSLSLGTSGLVDRHQIEILAFRAALLLGPAEFNSPGETLLRKILSWARQYGKNICKDKIERLRKVFDDVIEKFSFQISDGITDPSIWSRSSSWFETRGCRLPTIQRAEYDKACTEVRGSLSCCLELAEGREDSVFDSFEAVSTSLLRLRRQCFHSNINSLLANPTIRSRVGGFADIINTNEKSLADDKSGLFFRPMGDNSSQPDSSVAFSILEGSGKMRELVRILRSECDLKVRGDEALAPLLGSQDNPKPSKSRSSKKVNRIKKIAVLAVLPEVQIIASTLLSSIGINHDLLLRASTGEVILPDAAEDSYSEDEKFEATSSQTLAVAWSEYQTTLAKFNSESTASDPKIVIASPGCIAGYGGLGVDGADLIICLDEEWSGRSSFVMQYAAARWLVRNRLSSGDGCRLLRLVSVDTCEEKLLSTSRGPTGEQSANHVSWPLSLTGHHCFPMLPSDAISLYLRPPALPPVALFAFPGVNLIRFRDDDLEEVLAPSMKLPQLFGSGSRVRFLPFSESVKKTADSKNARAEVSLIKDLLVREELAALGRTHSTEHRDKGLGDDLATSIALTSICAFPPSSASFPRMMITRQDLNMLSCRLYFERLVKSAAWNRIGSSAAGANVDPVKDPALATSAKTDVTPSSVMSNNSDLADAWRKSGLSCKPDDVAASLLFYRLPQSTKAQVAVTGKDSDEQNSNGYSQKGKDTPKVDLRGRRSNAYARAFALTQDGNLLRDGNQGREPLVYFPPLFPRLLQCSIQAKQDADAMPANHSGGLGTSGPDEQSGKRKDILVGEDDGSAKRPRIQIESDAPASAASPAPAQLQALQASSTGQQPSLQPPTDVALVSSPATTLPAPVGGGASGVRLIGEDNVALASLPSELTGFGEDFGLLGVGAMALPADAMMALSHDSVETGESARQTSRSISYDLSSSTIPCDIEEAQAAERRDWDNVNLDSVVLFVKKKPRGFPYLQDSAGQLYRQPHGVLHPDAPWSGPKAAPAASIMGVGSSFTDVNGTGGPKKTKKKTANQAIASMPPSSFSRLPSADVVAGGPMNPAAATIQLQKGKDGLRHRVLASFMSRQIHTGLTMFESASYQVAAVRVQSRIAERFARQCWKLSLSNEFGPGIPLGIAKQQSAMEASRKRGIPEGDTRLWTSIAKRLKTGSSTGDTAKAQALSQRSSLRRSLISPCRVDFGPFKSGFLSLPSGMTGISPPKSRLGVSLPMGVKVPQALREHQQQSWSSADDRRLQDFAVRFGMNWMLVARALSGLEDIILASGRESSTDVNRRSASFPRSARQCRDRWEALARNQPSLANEVRKSERVLRVNARLRTHSIPGGAESAMTLAGPGNQATVALLSKPTTVSLASKEEAYGSETQEVTADIEPPDGTSLGTNGVATTEPDNALSAIDSEASAQPSKKPARRSFGFLTKAKTKTQVFPLTIPGAVGSNPPTLVPSHPSHMASVQESAAAQSSSGRTEMWPLQILDVADKQRASASAAQRASGASSSAGTAVQQATGPSPSTASSSSASRRQASSSAHRSASSYQASSSSAGRGASFPPVPPSSGRTSSSSSHQHRQQQQQQASSSSSSAKKRSSSTSPPPPRTTATTQASSSRTTASTSKAQGGGYAPPPSTKATPSASKSSSTSASRSSSSSGGGGKSKQSSRNNQS